MVGTDLDGDRSRREESLTLEFVDDVDNPHPLGPRRKGRSPPQSGPQLMLQPLP